MFDFLFKTILVHIGILKKRKEKKLKFITDYFFFFLILRLFNFVQSEQKYIKF